MWGVADSGHEQAFGPKLYRSDMSDAEGSFVTHPFAERWELTSVPFKIFGKMFEVVHLHELG